VRVYGLDFTSAPRPRKPITCFEGVFEDGCLRQQRLAMLDSFRAFEAFLNQPGPWIAGMDFPFAQSRRFVENIGWPRVWSEYVEIVGGMDRPTFRATLEDYKRDRAPGDKEHHRAVDHLAKSISPQKLYGVPVGLMFFEGAPRLRRAGVHIPGLNDGDPTRVVVEAYPGVVARRLIGRRSYKSDTRKKQTAALHEARREMFQVVTSEYGAPGFDVTVKADAALADDPSGDSLDAMICALQAAWAWSRRDAGFGLPPDMDPVEGWIADPALV